MSELITKNIASDLIKDRDENPFEKIEDFTGSDALKQYKLSSEETSNLSVSSKYFLLNSNARIGQSRARVQSLIFRGDQEKIHVLQRSQATL